jgi:hypothetical protein
VGGTPAVPLCQVPLVVATWFLDAGSVMKACASTDDGNAEKRHANVVDKISFMIKSYFK